MPRILSLPGLKTAPRSAPKSRMDTMVITPDSVARWRVPPFQRPLKVNEKVRNMADVMGKLAKAGETVVIEGVITLGILDNHWYIVDGQHRMEAFRLSEAKEALVDVRIVDFEDMVHMAEEFAKLNDSIVRMTPDDKLRAMESGLAPLATIRQRCKFVGYGNLRRGGSGPILSMSLVLRTWSGAGVEMPQPHGSAMDLAHELTPDGAASLCEFLNACYAAWGSDQEYARLWGSLNLVMCAWLWRRTVTGQYSSKSVKLTKDEFIKCLMALSAKGDYMDWLVGRNGARAVREFSPAYLRIRSVFVSRLQAEGRTKFFMPAPGWASGGGHVRLRA